MHNYPPGQYIATHFRCAIDFSVLGLNISQQEALEILAEKGFCYVQADLAEIARKEIGASIYEVGALPNEAPGIVNCRTIIKWLYSKKGVWLPAHMSGLGISVSPEDLCEGDLVYVTDPHSPSGGHVGMASDAKTVFHANRGIGLVEEPFDTFSKKDGVELRGIRRIIVNLENTLTLTCPPECYIEWSGDIASIIRRELGAREKLNRRQLQK